VKTVVFVMFVEKCICVFICAPHCIEIISFFTLCPEKRKIKLKEKAINFKSSHYHTLSKLFTFSVFYQIKAIHIV